MLKGEDQKIIGDLKRKIEGFPENSIIRNLFWCEVVSVLPDGKSNNRFVGFRNYA